MEQENKKYFIHEEEMLKDIYNIEDEEERETYVYDMFTFRSHVISEKEVYTVNDVDFLKSYLYEKIQACLYLLEMTENESDIKDIEELKDTLRAIFYAVKTNTIKVLEPIITEVGNHYRIALH